MNHRKLYGSTSTCTRTAPGQRTDDSQPRNAACTSTPRAAFSNRRLRCRPRSIASGAGAGRGLTVSLRINLFSRLKSPGELRDRVARGRVSHVWVHQPLAEVQTALEVDLAPRASHLLRRVDGRWELVRSWPYDGYDDPHSPDLPD